MSRAEQEALLGAVTTRLRLAPLFCPVMPRTGKAFSVEMTNFGPLGWVADKDGYRYQATHPVSGAAWPAIPRVLLRLWHELTGWPDPPQACLVNRYGQGARLGLHQDKDEEALDAPVLSISLGDRAAFRIGGAHRRDPTRRIWLNSGDVCVLAGAARLAFHGIDRVIPQSSTLCPQWGRINLTLRRVTPA